MLTASATVCEFSDSSTEFGLSIETNDETLTLSCASAIDQMEWRAKIAFAIGELTNSVRGYLSKSGRFLEGKTVKVSERSSGSGGGGGSPRHATPRHVTPRTKLSQLASVGVVQRFFLLHKDGITYHHDEHKTSVIQGMRKFSKKTTVEIDEAPLSSTFIVQTNLKDQKFWKLTAPDSATRDKWVSGIRNAVDNIGFMEIDYLDASADQLQVDCMKSGFLSIRPKQGGVDWLDRFYILSNSKLYQFQDSDSVKPANIYVLR